MVIQRVMGVHALKQLRVVFSPPGFLLLVAQPAKKCRLRVRRFGSLGHRGSNLDHPVTMDQQL